MEFILSCSACITKQIAQIAEIKNLEKNKAHEIMRKVLNQLANADYSLSTPQLMGNVWDILEKEFVERDVYKEIKYFYNKALLQQENLICENINSQKDNYERFRQSLIFAICGNLIDLAATDVFDTKASMASSCSRTLCIESPAKRQRCGSLSPAPAGSDYQPRKPL